MNKKDNFIMRHRKAYSMEDKVFLAVVDKVLLIYNPNNYLDIDKFINVFIEFAAHDKKNEDLQSVCKELVKMFCVLKHATKCNKTKDNKEQVDNAHEKYGERVLDLLCLLSDDKEYKMFKALWPWMPDGVANKLLQKLAYNPNATLYDMSRALGAGLTVDSNTIGLIKNVAVRDYNKANKNAEEIRHGLSSVMECVDKSDWYHAKSNAALLNKMLGVSVIDKPKEDHWTLRQERADKATEHIIAKIGKQLGSR